MIKKNILYISKKICCTYQKFKTIVKSRFNTSTDLNNFNIQSKGVVKTVHWNEYQTPQKCMKQF